MMKADVERADHDGLEDDPEVLGVSHVEEELGMGQAREDPQLLGESTPAALPDGEPLPSPLVGPHVSLVTGSKAREEEGPSPGNCWRSTSALSSCSLLPSPL